MCRIPIIILTGKLPALSLLLIFQLGYYLDVLKNNLADIHWIPYTASKDFMPSNKLSHHSAAYIYIVCNKIRQS